MKKAVQVPPGRLPLLLDTLLCGMSVLLSGSFLLAAGDWPKFDDYVDRKISPEAQGIITSECLTYPANVAGCAELAAVVLRDPPWCLERMMLQGLFAFQVFGSDDAVRPKDTDAKPLATSAKGPLRVHPTNPRYFTDGTTFADGSLKAVYLTGSHTWNNLQDMGETDPPARFDFNAYLDFLGRHNHNFIRLWRWELVSWDTKANREKVPRHLVCAPHPWARTGPGAALDGKPRFNLERFDEDYFVRLRDRVMAAGARGIYISIMLFEGWGLQFVPRGWEGHPFHPANNVNGVDGDANKDGQGVETHTLTNPAITRLQEAYVRKVIDTVNDLSNVLYEISNENHPPSTEWQYHFIRYIRQCEQSKPQQHPVGMTFQYRGGSNAALLASPADWISPNPQAEGGFDYRDDPPPADGRKVILCDTDHLWGIGGNATWVWKAFTRGHNPLFMDPYKGAVLDSSTEGKWEEIRWAMEQARRLAERFNLAAMTPHGELASTRYCLANAGVAYVVYLPAGGDVTVDLTGASRTLAAEWSNPRTGAASSGGTVTGGAKREFRAPGEGDWVLLLEGR
ncbi:MAG: putative collagen-binding domain-containing protein [Phycisphaerae bacterium]